MSKKTAENGRAERTIPRALALLAMTLLLAACSEPADEAAQFDPAALVSLLGQHTREARREEFVFVTSDTILPTVYAPTLDPRSFRARLNGHDVSAAFHPRPQSVEPVDLAEHLRPGLNELEFTAAPQRPDGQVEAARAYTVKVRHTAGDRMPIILLGTDTSPPPPPLGALPSTGMRE